MRLSVLIGFLLCSLSFRVAAQDLSSEAVKAFSQGDISSLSTSLSDEVSLSLINSKKRVPKSEAIVLVNEFLKSSPIVSFQKKHASVREGSAYMIGSRSKQEGRYRVNCFYKKENGKFFIHQIRIDKVNE